MSKCPKTWTILEQNVFKWYSANVTWLWLAYVEGYVMWKIVRVVLLKHGGRNNIFMNAEPATMSNVPWGTYKLWRSK